MRGAILLSVAALFCGLGRVTEATTCTSGTLKTCEKSLFMTGKCSSGICACVSGYKPGLMGCQKQQKAVITTDFDGEAETGAKIVLSCSKGIGSSSYSWFKDGEAINSEKSETYTIDVAAESHNGAYKCQSSISGLDSEISDAFTITVSDSITSKPEVIGMPTIMVDGAQITFTCKTTAIYKNPAYTWSIDGTPVPEKTQKNYVHTLAKEKDATTKLKCTAAEGFDSAEVVFPADTQFADDIEGVKITPVSSLALKEGDDLKLECKQTGEFPEPEDGDTKFTISWKKDAEVMGTETSTSLTIEDVTKSKNAGSYICEVTAGANAAKVSEAVTVTVTESTIAGDKDIQVSSKNPLKKGYFSLTCDYDTPNTLLPVTYKWLFDRAELPGVTDSVLQFNEADTDDLNGKPFVCQVTGTDATVKSKEFTPQLSDSSVITSASPTLNSPGDHGVGTTTTFTCTPTYITPGISYIWTVGGVKEDGEVTNTFEYTPKSTAQVTIGCKYEFDEKTSLEATKNINPKYVFSAGIKLSGKSVSTLKPVAETTLKLTCDVAKSDGAGSVTYAWKNGEETVAEETSKDYEFKAGAADSTALRLTCEATADSESKTSEVVEVQPQATAEKPTLEMPPTIKIGAEVVMTCSSASHADGAKFEWLKGDTAISGETSVTYKINAVAKSDDGGYTCKITVGGVTSEASEAVTLTAAANEKTCVYASHCNLENMDTTVCDDGKCKCLSGYKLLGGTCSGAAAVMGSLLMMVYAFLVHRTF